MMMENKPESDEMESNPVVPQGQEGIPDYSQGYQIVITCKPDGYTVSGPSPLPQTEPVEESEEVDLTTALKHVIAITKENPLDGSDHAQFDAGYAGE